MNASTISILDFNFTLQRTGIYLVVYTSPKTGKQWKRVVTDMSLIDSVKNSDYPTKADMNRLKKYVKSESYNY